MYRTQLVNEHQPPPVDLPHQQLGARQTYMINRRLRRNQDKWPRYVLDANIIESLQDGKGRVASEN